jgi:Uma2 family endonuclease
MTVAFARRSSPMNVPEFLSFLRSRPDEERWELIGGVPMMVAPPTIRHQRIASNLERLLNDALRRRRPTWRADREIGLVLEAFGYYRPEPEIAVVDTDLDEEETYAKRFYLVAEVISSRDETPYDNSDKSLIDIKLGFYKAHEHNRCIIVIRQDRIEVGLHVRRQDGTWPDEPVVLTSADDVIAIDEIGQVGAVGDLYRGTSLVSSTWRTSVP